MLRVAAAKLLADLRIGPFPEASQVVGDLLRAMVRAEQVQEHGKPTASQSGRFGNAKDLLDSHRKN